MKKSVCCILVAIIILSYPHHSFATSVVDPTPTVEEILSEYHSNVMQRDSTEPASTPTQRSSQANSSTETLEEETVRTLTDAGYEAYNITAANYSSLEASLCTDFADLGLSSDSSYIVIIEGEDTTSVSRGSVNPFPEFTCPDPPVGSSTFVYFEDGVTYTMRYVTITGADDSELRAQTDYTLSEAKDFSDYADDVLTHVVSYIVSDAIDDIFDSIPLSSIAELLIDIHDDDPLTLLDPGTLFISAGTTWTRSYIQVWDETTQLWYTSQCSAYASSVIQCTSGLLFNSETNEYVAAVPQVCSFTTYSPYYNNSSLRKSIAVQGYNAKTKLHDCTGNIYFYVTTESGININGSAPLFYHAESLAYLLPYVQEE